ncbi:hypothetical protein [Clostridium thermarum]|uniref:hypothetical protein n=1 Tax=Clostridium thermarum TaxID=1716543 RepID=UPI0011202042|nr:hypothetical protein [Clostridium thermarum]
MKKINVYYVNEGLDGVVVAKSLKQAIKKLAPYYASKTHKVKQVAADMVKEIKKDWKDSNSQTWSCEESKVSKKGKHRRSKLLGWYEW